MRIYLLRAVLRGSAFFIFSWSFALNLLASPRAQHVFIISIDGGKPTVIAQSEMPVLKELAREGACTWEACTILPSITLPSHTSMLTGVGPKKHKISWNSWKPRKGAVRVPTVFSVAKAAGFSTAMFVGKEKFRQLLQPNTVDYFDYNPELTGDLSHIGGRLIFNRADTVLAGPVAEHAANWIVEKKPNLCFIHLTDADKAGHKYGWGSPEQIQAFAKIDAALGVILKGIKSAGITDESVLIITADHGGHRKTHGDNTPEDVMIPWIAWGKDVKKESTIAANVTTCDTAATALWILGLPLPTSCDGAPVTDAFN
jgi:predicted AlkP superfamily pyrophosphatase or phosphodiesterase